MAPILLFAVSACEPEYQFVDVSDKTDSGSEAEREIDYVQFTYECGNLEQEAAQHFTEGAETHSMIGQVFTRDESCSDGDPDPDCVYDLDGTLSHTDEFDISPASCTETVFYDYYVEVTASAELDAVVSSFGVSGNIEYGTYVHIEGRILCSASVSYGSPTEQASLAAYAAENDVQGVDGGAVWKAEITRWTMEQHEYIGAEAAANDPTGALKINGKFYSSTGSVETYYETYLCIHPFE